MTARTILAMIGFIALTDVSAQDTVPRFESTDCHFETDEPLEGVDCGELVVWENREDHEEGTLRLAVAILRSTADEPEPDPLVFLSGGPGGRSVYYVPRRAGSDFWNRFRKKRDVVFYDQRGTGYSEPKFCDRLDRVFYSTRFLGLPLKEAVARRVKAAEDCRERMLAKGIDFSAYNSETSARDLDDLRRALGYDRWNVFGLSYGTRLALTAMRETPGGIRSVILDSTVPTNVRTWVENPAVFARSLDRVFAQCAADEACRQAYPDLERKFYTWLDRLEREPVELKMEDTTRFPDGRLVVDRSLALGAVFQGLYDRRFPPLLPLLVREGGPEGAHVWRALAGRMVRGPSAKSWGLNLSVTCYEFAPFNPPAMLDAAHAEHPRLEAIRKHRVRHAECASWHDERADSSYFEPVRSELPTLIMEGEFDSATPLAWGRLVADTLSNSTFVEAPAHGHVVVSRTSCTRNLANEFLDDPGQSLDTSCVSEIPSVSFITDVHVSPGVYPVARSVQQGPGMPILAGTGMVGFIFLSGLFGWPIGAMVNRVRGIPSGKVAGLQRASRWTAALAMLLSLGFVAGLVFAIRDAASANPLLLVFGVSGEFGWLFLLPWLATVLTVLVVLASAESWRSHWWHIGHRIHYSLVAAGLVIVLAFAGWWGFL